MLDVLMHTAKKKDVFILVYPIIKMRKAPWLNSNGTKEHNLKYIFNSFMKEFYRQWLENMDMDIVGLRIHFWI